jgi:hypothetical protein
MDEDGEEPLPWFEADKDFANKLIPESSQWYEPGDKEFPDHEDLSITYSWSNYCTCALDDLRRHSCNIEFAGYCDDEDGTLTFDVFRFIKIIIDVTIVQQELLARQNAFKKITEQLAARRFEVSGGHDVHSTFRVCNRCYPCALDGLLDVHKRVGVHVYPAGTPILSAMASVLPHVRSSTPLHAPYYAGHAAAKRFPNDGLDSQSIITLANSPEFQEAVSKAYRKHVMPRVFDQIRDFDGQVVLAGIKAELSILCTFQKLTPVPNSVWRHSPFLPKSPPRPKVAGYLRAPAQELLRRRTGCQTGPVLKLKSEPSKVLRGVGGSAPTRGTIGAEAQ